MADNATVLHDEEIRAEAERPEEAVPGDGGEVRAGSAEAGAASPEEQPETAPGKKKKKSTEKALLRLLIKLAVIALIGWLLLTFVIGIFVVHTNDMYPAVRDGDLLITWRIDPPERGAIVAYTVNGERRFGRVVGIAGDVIEIGEGGYFRLNGGVPIETVYYETARDPESEQVYPYTVPEDAVFVLNELRENTGDSRRFGAVPAADTDGSVGLLLRRRSW